MAIKFLGYIDTPDEELEGKRRCMFGCGSSADITSLPTVAGLSLPSGAVTAAPADWSYALVKGGTTQVLTGWSWGDL